MIPIQKTTRQDLNYLWQGFVGLCPVPIHFLRPSPIRSVTVWGGFFEFWVVTGVTYPLQRRENTPGPRRRVHDPAGPADMVQNTYFV